MRISDWSSDVCSSDLLERMSRSSWQAVARWGFKQEPNVPQVLLQIVLAHPESNLDPMQSSYFLSRQTVIVVRKLPLHQALSRRLFAFMARNVSRDRTSTRLNSSH